MIVIGGYRHPELGFKVIGEFDSALAGQWLEEAYFDLTQKVWEDWGTNEHGKRVMIDTRLLTPLVMFDQNLERMFDAMVGHENRWFNKPPYCAK